MADMSEVHESIEVDAPIEDVYNAWTNFPEFPRFMSNIEEVRETAQGRYHWKGKGPLGASAEWDAYIVENIPNELIAWRSDDENSVRVNGAVRFMEQSAGRTTVDVNMGYQAPMGALGETVAKIFSNPGQQTREDLQRFKDLIESGAGSGRMAQVPPSGPPADRGEI
jgi:uncharacterized membrane protein